MHRTFRETETPLKWSQMEIDAETELERYFIEDKKEAYALTVTGHLVAIWGKYGHCTCLDFTANRRRKTPCKHLVCLKELMENKE